MSVKKEIQINSYFFILDNWKLGWLLHTEASQRKYLAPAFINNKRQGAILIILLLGLVIRNYVKTYWIKVKEAEVPVKWCGEKQYISEVAKLFCVITAFPHLTQSVYSVSCSSHSPEVWCSLKHLQLNSNLHLTEMVQLDFHFSLWCLVLVHISAATQHQNQTLQSYYLYYYYLFWLILHNYTHREGNVYLGFAFSCNLIYPVGSLSCLSSGGLRLVHQVVTASRAAQNQAHLYPSLYYTVPVYTYSLHDVPISNHPA